MLAVRYPYLYRYIDNGSLNSSEVADIYRNSKICLNVHVGGAKSCNPRTFEILATGAWQMIDSREYYDLLIPNDDLIVYNNEDELLELIDKYLKKEENRKKIAINGYNKAKQFYKLEQVVRKLLV